jgi:cytochrome P450
MSPKGYDFAGIHLPQGAIIGAPGWPITHDPRNWPNPNGYDPFRFSRPREEFAASRREAAASRAAQVASTEDTEKRELLDVDENAGLLLHKDQGLLNTSETFLAFGHGKHAW